MPAAKKNASEPTTPKENVVYRLDPVREAGKLVFQLGSSDPERAVAAARVVAADVSGIDLNAGCPKPFSTSGGMGAALLRDPDRLCAILHALVATVIPEFSVGVSVKIRVLETAEKTEALVRRLVATGITGLTVHCRTTPMRPRERAIRGQLKMIANVCREAGVACLMNGDVESRDQAVDLVREFGVDGAMIATAAEKNPSCFRPRDLGGRADWREVVSKYVAFAIDVGNRFPNTKYLLSQMIPGKEKEYKTMTTSKSNAQLCRVLGLEDLVEAARDLDERKDLGSGDASSTIKPAKKAPSANAAALAAAGKMAEARSLDSMTSPKKSISERGLPLVSDPVQQPQPAPVTQST
jgi:tRNA-dihydrouridine synthase 2